jgi:hypothetical protein
MVSHSQASTGTLSGKAKLYFQYPNMYIRYVGPNLLLTCIKKSRFDRINLLDFVSQFLSFVSPGPEFYRYRKYSFENLPVPVPVQICGLCIKKIVKE